MDRLKGVDISFYVIIDREWQRGRDLGEMTESALSGGASIVQYRDKVSAGGKFYAGALEVREVCRRFGVPLLVNDRLDVALAVGADGVHLGQEDLPVSVARNLGGENFLVGVTAATYEQGLKGARDGADYLGVGAAFPTTTKRGAETAGLGVIRQLRAEVECPIVAVGGITASNLGEVLAAGAQGIAVISSLLDGDIEQNARILRRAISIAHKGR